MSSSYSPPPSPSGRTSSGNYLRSNFSPGRERPTATSNFALQDEGKGTPAWMKKLLEQKKAEYRARWGELPNDGDDKDKSSKQQQQVSAPAPPAVADDDHDGETIEEIIYEEEIIEEVVVNDDDDDEYTEEEIVTTDDEEYTYEEVVTSGDEEEPVVAAAPTIRKGGKRPTQESVPPPPARPPRTTPTPIKSRPVESPPVRPEPPRATQPTAPRNSFSLQRMMADEVAASPKTTTGTTSSHRATAAPSKSTSLDNTARPVASPPRTTAATQPPPAAANEAALRAQLAALEVELAEARRRQGSPSPPRERPVATTTTTSPPRAAAVPTTKSTPRAASPPTASARPSTTQSASPRTESPPPPPPPRVKSPPPPPRGPSPPPRASSPKRVQFSETASPPPPPPPPPVAPTPIPTAAMPPEYEPSNDEGDSMYDYVIEIDTINSSSAGASTSVYEIEYEDASTIASRRVPPTIQEGDEEMPAQQKGKAADAKPKKSRNRVLAMWLGCCACLLLLLLGGLVAGAFLVEDELDFLPFVGDDSGDDSASTNKDLQGSVTRAPTTEPVDTITPTVAPVANSPATSPSTGNAPNTTPPPPTAPPTMDSEAVSTLSPTLPFFDFTTGRPTLSLTGPPTAALTTNSPTSTPTSAPVATVPPTSIPIFTPPTPPPVEPPPPGPGFEWALTSGPFTSAENIGFGEAVAVDGNILVVGAPGSGRVLAYSRSSNSNTWSALNEVSPSEEASDFGAAIAISVGTSRVAMAVGAPSSLDTQGFQMPFGAAFYYELTGQDWTQLGSRAAPNPNVFNANGEAGAAVAVAAESRRMAVGAPSVTIDADNIDNGQVSVYEFDGTDLTLLSTVDGIEPGGLFGFAVRLTSDGNRLLVGAPGSVGSSSGAVYYYEWDVTSWRMILPVPGSTPTENLGTSVAILDSAGDIIAMGGPNYDGDRGIIRVYRRQSGGFWGPLGGVIVGEPGDFLGTTLAAGPNNGVVAGTADSFRAFELIGSEWVRVGTGEPSFDSKVTGVGASSSGDITVGIADGSVSIYGLGL